MSQRLTLSGRDAPSGAPELCFRGKWLPGTNYYAGDTVLFGGQLWQTPNDQIYDPNATATFVGSAQGAAFGPTTGIGQLALPAAALAGDVAVIHVGVDNLTNSTTTAILRAPTGAAGPATLITAFADLLGSNLMNLINAIYTYVLTPADIANGYLTFPAPAVTQAGAQNRAIVLVMRGLAPTADTIASAVSHPAITVATSITVPAFTAATVNGVAFYCYVQQPSTSSTGTPSISPNTPRVLNTAAVGGTGTVSLFGYVQLTSTAAPAETYNGKTTVQGSGGTPATAGFAISFPVSVGTAFVPANWALMSSEPIGAIKAYGGLSTPYGYLPCDGSAVSRATYADLYAVLGTAYGAGDGSTTFNLPQLQATFPRGSTTRGGAGGAASHSHPLSESGYAKVVTTGTTLLTKRSSINNWASEASVSSNAISAAATTVTSAAGPGAQLGGVTDVVTTLPPYLDVGYIIKY